MLEQYSTPIMMGLIFVVFYFFFIRPQAQQVKRQKAFVEGLKSGDRVVTNAGIVGRVVRLDREAGSFTLETGRNTQMECTIASVSSELTKSRFKLEDK